MCYHLHNLPYPNGEKIGCKRWPYLRVGQSIGNTFNSITLKTLLLVQPDTFMYSFNVCEGESRAWMEGFHNFSFFSASAPYAPLHTCTFQTNSFQMKKICRKQSRAGLSQLFLIFRLCSPCTKAVYDRSLIFDIMPKPKFSF